jgi:hypothetical protein
MTAPSPRRAASGCLPRLLLALASLALAFAAGEVLVRRLYPPISPLRDIIVKVPDERGYVLRPNTRQEFAGTLARFAHPTLLQINAQGLRDDQPTTAAPPAGRTRISTYGDSENFCWAVALEDTFQRRLEAADGKLSVLNFGIPGYNIANVAKHIEATAPLYRPALLIYVIHPNDFEGPVRFVDLPVHSELIMRLAALYYIKVWKPRQLLERRTPAAIRNFTAQLLRIERFCARGRIPLAIALLDRGDSFVLRLDRELEQYFLDPRCQAQRVIDFTPVMRGFPKLDDHMPAAAHVELARIVRRVLQAGEGSGCWPRLGAF